MEIEWWLWLLFHKRLLVVCRKIHKSEESVQYAVRQGTREKMKQKNVINWCTLARFTKFFDSIRSASHHRYGYYNECICVYFFLIGMAAAAAFFQFQSCKNAIGKWTVAFAYSIWSPFFSFFFFRFVSHFFLHFKIRRSNS